MQDASGKVLMTEDIQASMKNSIVVPTDFHGMLGSFKRYHKGRSLSGSAPKALSLFLLVPLSFVPNIKDLEFLISSVEVNDPRIHTKIMFAKVFQEQMFWRACLNCEDREDVIALSC